MNEYPKNLLSRGSTFKMWSDYMGEYQTFMVFTNGTSYWIGIIDTYKAGHLQASFKEDVVNNCSGLLKSTIQKYNDSIRTTDKSIIWN